MQLRREPHLGVDDAVVGQVLRALARDAGQCLGRLHHADRVRERLQVQDQILAAGSTRHPRAELVGIGGREPRVPGLGPRAPRSWRRGGRRPGGRGAGPSGLGGSVRGRERRSRRQPTSAATRSTTSRQNALDPLGVVDELGRLDADRREPRRRPVRGSRTTPVPGRPRSTRRGTRRASRPPSRARRCSVPLRPSHARRRARSSGAGRPSGLKPCPYVTMRADQPVVERAPPEPERRPFGAERLRFEEHVVEAVDACPRTMPASRATARPRPRDARRAARPWTRTGPRARRTRRDASSRSAGRPAVLRDRRSSVARSLASSSG